VALGAQHAILMQNIICDLSGYTIFFLIILLKAIFSKKAIERKMSDFIFPTNVA
jgi:hypothetical protein